MITDYGLKWVKPDADVDTAGLGETLINSAYPILKKKLEGTGSVNIDTDGSESDVLIDTHDLGYEPQYELLIQWIDLDTGDKKTTYINAPVYNGLFADLGIYLSIRPYMTSTEFRLAVSIFDGYAANHDLDYIYKVYYDPDADL